MFLYNLVWNETFEDGRLKFEPHRRICGSILSACEALLGGYPIDSFSMFPLSMKPAAPHSAKLDLDSDNESSQEVPMSCAGSPVKNEVPTSTANFVKEEPDIKTLPNVAPGDEADEKIGTEGQWA